MRMKSLVTAVALAASVIVVHSAGAGTPPNYTALLNGGQAVPPTTTTAFGVAFLTFDKTTGMLCVSLTTTALIAAETAVHIHGPASPGVSAPVVFPLSLGNPMSACVGPLDRTQQSSLKKSQLYINVHSAAFPAGEIRGQITPSMR